ncbi:hypothetical protein BGX38DRAFT_1281644 [Terfezia claveryi]|nr:hypothetical protein BGX38DRAFT_1281644 [Terfezia claveryi]
MRNRLASGSESHKKALEALLQDCLKKHSETSKNLAIKRARKRAHAYENSDEEDDISDADEAAATVVAFWVCDLEIAEHRDINGWIWDKRDRRNLVVIQTKTLDGIWDMVKAHVPADRKVREILGALKDPNPPNLSFPADYTGLHSDAEVKAFFRMSKSDPVRLMVLLHSVPPRANTPPRAHPYFELEKFIPRNEYEDFAEDSDANYELRGRVDRQRETLSDIKKEHKRLFPNAGIIDSDDEDYCYIQCLKRPKITSGLQLVKARQVVAGKAGTGARARGKGGSWAAETRRDKARRCTREMHQRGEKQGPVLDIQDVGWGSNERAEGRRYIYMIPGQGRGRNKLLEIPISEAKITITHRRHPNKPVRVSKQYDTRTSLFECQIKTTINNNESRTESRLTLKPG